MPVKSFSGKQTFITGAASGIGRSTALLAARSGAVLFLTDVQDEALDGVVAEIRAAGGDVRFAQAADITDHEAVQAMADAIHAEHGAMDVVMNIAGISRWGSVQTLAHEDWRDQIEVNLMGPIHVIEAFVGPMIEAGRGGHLVNVSSAAGLFGLPWHAAYSATKFGLRGISEVLRFDLRRHGIGVSLVCPGGVDTPLVGTVRIVGVDRDNPTIQKMIREFQRHAVTPDKAAEAIIDGVVKNRYMVFTSRDIQVGYFFQRKFALPYELFMRVMNDRFVAVTRKATVPASAPAPSAEPSRR